MPKLKIHKTAAKRFKVTATGKLFRQPGATSHLRGHETASEHKRKEGLREVTGTYKNRVKRLINM